MSETKKSRPERLIPHPISRDKAQEAPPLSRDIRKQVVGQYRDLLREAEAARAMVRHLHAKRTELQQEPSQDGDKPSLSQKRELARVDAQLGRWMQTFARQKRHLDALREQHGASLDRAHREWVHERMSFVDFIHAFRKLHEVERAIRAWKGVDLVQAKSAPKRRQRAVAGQMERGGMTSVEGVSQDESPADMADELEDAVDFIFGDEATRDALKAEIQASLKKAKAAEAAKAKAAEAATVVKALKAKAKAEEDEGLHTMSLPELEGRREELLIDCEDAWKRPGVQRRWFEREFHGWVEASLRGDRVLEFPSVIALMNELEDIETTFTNTTIGGVLVGEPGVGKTAIINHFLQNKGRKAVYIDMSEEVTRYQLMGSPSMQVESGMDQFRRFAEAIAGMDDNAVMRLVKEQSEKLGPAFSFLDAQEREIAAFAQLKEQMGDSEAVRAVRERLEDLVQRQYRSEVAKKFVDLTKKNGWRDGIVIHALRNNHPLIIDEFNMAKSWTLLHKLLESTPGEKFYFGDNNEWIEIPEDWRMYFTGNIGKKHGTFGVREALASRLGGKVLEVSVPPQEEERTGMLAFVSDADDRLIRQPHDAVQLMYFIRDVIPKIRHAIRDEKNVIPVSYRLLRDLSDQLVDHEAMRSGDKTLDQALMKVLIHPYAVFETREIPKLIIQYCLAAGLLLGNEVEDDVVKWSGIGKNDLEQLRKDHAGTPEDNAAALERFRSEDVKTLTAALPARPL